jgi:hypothetical protein
MAELVETEVGDARRVHPADSFLAALFEESDTILFRPIETWIEGDKKQSRALYRETLYRKNVPALRRFTLLQLEKTSFAERANIFLGVCPRFGDKGQYDLAWQIRIVRAVWADVDNSTVDKVLKRVDASRLPAPSIVVSSGNGVHLYWHLESPYLVDDAGDPPPVFTEWIASPGGRKKPQKYIEEAGERVFLDRCLHAARLSPKAHHFQDILAGVADAIGGDHTTDLSRLLRVPGTLNRKDERNGRAPVLCELMRCEAERRYSLALFEPFATPSHERQREARIAAMPLPRARKPTATKLDKLAERIAICSVAPVGVRSEADFALCCFAIRSGIAADEIRPQVESIGKFSEAGRSYFDRTWEKAEYQVRATYLTKIERQAPVAPHATGNGELDEPIDDDGLAVIHVDPTTTPVVTVMGQVTQRLLDAKLCYVRSGQVVALRNDVLSPILSAAELSGLLNHVVEFFFVDDEAGEYKPLPPAYGNVWLNQPGERARLPPIAIFTRNPVYTDDWRLVGPGYDEQSQFFYAGEPVESREGTEHLDALLRDFCFKSPSDRTNYLGVLLTTILIGRFIGSKPAAMFNGNQPELGKSILAQVIAILRDGRLTETVSYNPNDEEFEKRLGAVVRRGATTIIVDNAKGHGRSPRIESACLERSITDPILSYRLLGSSDSIRAENSHIFCITANSPDVSRDLVTRSVIINLEYEGNPSRRRFSIDDPEGYAQEHRAELLGELIGMVERWKSAGCPQARVATRFNKKAWGAIVGGILEVCGEPDFLANADEAAAQLDDCRREFGELLSILADHAQGTWTAGELVELAHQHGLLKSELGDASSRSQATRMGVHAGRYLAERFELPDRRTVVLHRYDERKGKVYRVEVAHVHAPAPNVEPIAERSPNVEWAQRSAS